MIRKFGLLAGCMMLLAGCTSHFISDEQFRDKVSQDFASRSHIMEAAGIDLSEMVLKTDEAEALEFLYAYMPLGDIVNRDPSFYHFIDLDT